MKPSTLLLTLAALISAVEDTPAQIIYTELHAFNGSDGSYPSYPYGGLILAGDTLYGTTAFGGGANNGTIFKINTDGTGFNVITSIGYSGPAWPSSPLTLSGTTLYSTARDGNANYPFGAGFKINTDGTGAAALPLNFTGLVPGDLVIPNGAPVLLGSNLYATTGIQGAGDWSGTIFKVSTNGTGLSVVWNANSTVGPPNGPLILSGNTFYGTTLYSVFKINTDGSGFTVLASTTNSGLGGATMLEKPGPSGGVVLSAGTLYGTAKGPAGGGFVYYYTIYKINTDGTGYTVLKYFADWAGLELQLDGYGTLSSLLVWSNTIYGATEHSGPPVSTPSGNILTGGTIYKIKTDGTGFTRLFTFPSTYDSGNKSALVMQNSTLYGTAAVGTIFSLDLGLPDLAAPSNSLAWDPSTGNLTVTYTNQGGPMTNSTTAKLFWAKGPTTNDILNAPPIFTTNIQAGFDGQTTLQLPESLFQDPAPNATFILLVLDPDDLVLEATKANNTFALTNTFRHVVLVMMENRSFDHFLGWLPNADGKQAHGTFTNAAGLAFSTYPLAPNFQGCFCRDPDHSFSGGRTQYDNGNCDGWLIANSNDTYSIGYYTQPDLPFLGQAAPNWTVCDRYFAAIMAETQPNRIYQHAAQTDRLSNSTTTSTLPTIWDTLSMSNVSSGYYFASTTFLQTPLYLWGGKYYSISAGIDQFTSDCANGHLPAVSFVEPLLTSTTLLDLSDVSDSAGNDDHPHSDIRNGEAFLARIYNAIVSSPSWSSTVLIINFDEWGGFFDHVPPPSLLIPPGELILGNDGLLGFRVPCLVISPWTHKGSVSHKLFDHTSVLKMIENHWGLPSLTLRDGNANDLADVLDLTNPDFTRPPTSFAPQGWFGSPCQHLNATTQPDGSISITWDATCQAVRLQTAPEPTGPWTDVDVNIIPPLVLPASSLINQQFMRFRIVAAPPPAALK